MIKALLELMRPYQYTKNLFIFLPPFFAFKLDEPQWFLNALIAFVAFCLAASAVYIFNDWKDAKEDRLHPEKKHRPIAGGKVQPAAALGLMGALLVAAGVLMATESMTAVGILAVYLVMNAAYTLKLKHVAIVDISIISIGFVLRLLVGSAVTGVVLSHWIIVMTFLLALFLSLAKRRDDVLIFLSTEQKTRKAIDGYNLRFLDNAMMMSAAIVVMAYILWSISPSVVDRLGSEQLYQTSIFVVLGVLRYMQIAFVEEKSGNPSKVLLKDRFIQLVLLGWLGSFVWILYLD